jgi:hypothetical protein
MNSKRFNIKAVCLIYFKNEILTVLAVYWLDQLCAMRHILVHVYQNRLRHKRKV